MVRDFKMVLLQKIVFFFVFGGSRKQKKKDLDINDKIWRGFIIYNLRDLIKKIDRIRKTIAKISFYFN